MDIIVISLKISVKRRTDFDKLNKIYIDYEYFDAINGKMLPHNNDIVKENVSGYVFTKFLKEVNRLKVEPCKTLLTLSKMIK